MAANHNNKKEETTGVHRMLCWEGRRRQTAAKWLFISITKHTVAGHNVAAAAAARHVLLTSFRKSRREQEEEELETTTGDREMGKRRKEGKSWESRIGKRRLCCLLRTEQKCVCNVTYSHTHLLCSRLVPWEDKCKSVKVGKCPDQWHERRTEHTLKLAIEASVNWRPISVKLLFKATHCRSSLKHCYL